MDACVEANLSAFNSTFYVVSQEVPLLHKVRALVLILNMSAQKSRNYNPVIAYKYQKNRGYISITKKQL
jgi:hypothetical protein